MHLLSWLDIYERFVITFHQSIAHIIIIIIIFVPVVEWGLAYLYTDDRRFGESIIGQIDGFFSLKFLKIVQTSKYPTKW